MLPRAFISQLSARSSDRLRLLFVDFRRLHHRVVVHNRHRLSEWRVRRGGTEGGRRARHSAVMAHSASRRRYRNPFCLLYSW